MTCNKKVRRAWTPGGWVAGVALAALLAGCGGGGGGGGGSSSSPTPPPTPTPAQPEVVVAGPTSVTSSSAATSVGSVTASTPTPELDIAAGAAQGSITVTISTDPNAPALPSGYTVVSSVYDIQPSGAQFNGAGITIKLPYTGTPANPTFLQIYYYDAPSGTWQPVQNGGRPSSITDTTNHDVSAPATGIAAGRTNGSGPADYVILGPPTPPTTPSLKVQ